MFVPLHYELLDPKLLKHALSSKKKCADQFNARAQRLMEFFLLKILPAYIQEDSFDPPAEHQASTGTFKIFTNHKFVSVSCTVCSAVGLGLSIGGL